MNIKQLRYFYEIANEGQITRAATKLHISQPPLSQSLKALEEDLEVVLFERNGRRMNLTEPGVVLYEKAKELFHIIQETQTEVKETGKGVRGKLSIGCNKSCFSHIPQKFRTFQETYPQVNFKLLSGDSYYLTKQLINREIEVAIVRLPINMQEFDYHLLPEEDYVVVIPNELVETDIKESISIKDLAKIPLLLLHRTRGAGQFEIIIDRFTEEKVTPNIICESPNVDMLLGLVNEGLGATIIPKSTLLKHNTSNVRVLKLENIKITSESAVIWLKDRYLSKSTQRFIELFKNEL